MEINSIKSLYVETFFNQIRLATATGFVVKYNEKFYLITNRHVVTGRNNINGKCLDEKNASIPNCLHVWLPSSIETGEIIHRINWDYTNIPLKNENDEPIWIEDKKEHRMKYDVAAIPLKEFDEKFSYEIDTDYETYVTDKVYIVGYPYGLDISEHGGKFGIWTLGSIASEPLIQYTFLGEKLPVILIDAKTRSGQSGSPVIYYDVGGVLRSEEGVKIYGKPITQTIGIYSGRFDANSDLGFVWQWNVIKEIIDGDMI